MAATSPSALYVTLKPKSLHSLTPYTSSLSTTSPLAFPSVVSSKKSFHYHISPHAVPQKHKQKWRISAAPENILLSEASPVENSQEIVSSTDDGVFTIISVLLFIAFIGLSILTIGVIYIAVTDFLQKREREKFEKEEAAKKKSGKKGKVRARARGGPRGFGQKIQEDDDYDD